MGSVKRWRVASMRIRIGHRERRVEAVDGRERADIGVALEDVLVLRLCERALEFRDDGRAAAELRNRRFGIEQARRLRELEKAAAAFVAWERAASAALAPPTAAPIRPTTCLRTDRVTRRS